MTYSIYEERVTYLGLESVDRRQHRGEDAQPQPEKHHAKREDRQRRVVLRGDNLPSTHHKQSATYTKAGAQSVPAQRRPPRAR